MSKLASTFSRPQPPTTVSSVPIDALYTPESLNGFDPEQNPRLGIFYAVRDHELGEQTLGAATDLPFADDPTLWSVLELVRK